LHNAQLPRSQSFRYALLQVVVVKFAENFFTFPIPSAYFIISEPTLSTQWVNGAPNLVTWNKGVQDGIDTFDVEMARLNSDGLTFVARDGERIQSFSR